MAVNIIFFTNNYALILCYVVLSSGSNVSADGSGDEAIKLQGLDHFSFSLADAKRDPLTGEFGEDEDIEDIEDVGALADAIAADSDNESIEAFTDKADSDDSDEGGYNTNEDCGPEYEPDDNLIVLEECP